MRLAAMTVVETEGQEVHSQSQAKIEPHSET